MIINSQRTIYGIDLQMDMLLNRKYTPLQNTTLNEKFSIATDKIIPEGIYPKLNYLVIGIGGHENMDDSDYKFSKHKAIDAALFKHVPFVMRTLDNDLYVSERKKYRLRKIENYNGITYACYYMKIIPNVIIKNGLFEIIKNDAGINTLKYFNTNRSDLLNPLEPVTRKIDNYLDTDKSTYIAKTTKIEFSLYLNEINDVRQAMEIIYGEVVNISEIGICSGLDYDDNGYIEVYGSVINYFVDVDLNTNIYFNSNDNILRAIEIGGMEPMVI